ncbi:MAG: hypothetical protein JSV41_01435 [Gemmatimonadota bacterium]|jgi:hypothetical protein|nr:MAG: hypothetical protein JSV41_01435 [Gemmatimonadota bacterium]
MQLSRLTLLAAFLLSFSVADVSFGQNDNGHETGNGARSGPHYNLNIIGMSKQKNADMTGNSGHRIFVLLKTRRPDGTVGTRISLREGDTYQVVDADGTDGGAIFELPAPGPYTIWVRALGRPHGQTEMATCAEDIADELDGGLESGEICSTGFEIERKRGRSRFQNVTEELTTIELPEGSDASLACDGKTTVSLFAQCLEGYFWAYDNNGLRLLQVRFYYEEP